MKYGYARVSTTKQGFGSSLDEQEDALRKEGAEVVVREEYTGTTAERPALTELLAKMVSGDTFMVCKMDRFARNTEDALAMIRQMRERNIKVHILNMGVMDNTPMGKMVRTMLAAFAEFERDMIVERTQAGIIRAKENGVPFGRKKLYTEEQLTHAIDLLKTHSFREVAAMTKISKATIVRERQKRNAAAG